MNETFDNIEKCNLGYDGLYDDSYNEGIKDATQIHILGLIIKSNQNDTIKKFDNQ